MFPPTLCTRQWKVYSSVHLCDEPTACPFASPSFQRHKHWKGQKEGRIIPTSAHQNKKKKRVGSIFNYFCTPKSSTKTVKYSTKWDRDGYAASRNVYVFLIDVCLHTNVLSLFCIWCILPLELYFTVGAHFSRPHMIPTRFHIATLVQAGKMNKMCINYTKEKQIASKGTHLVWFWQ